MISKEQAILLASIMETDGSFTLRDAESRFTAGMISDCFDLGNMGCLSGVYEHDAPIKVTDTGRLRLEEWQGAQEVSADASPVVSDAATIAALEAENAALRGLLAKALNAIAPFAESVSDDDVIAARDNAPLFVDRADGDDVISIRHGVNFETLKIGDLRAIATIAADIRAALDPTTPYEDTPDGSDYMATACTQCGKSNTECVCGADDDE